MAGTVNCLHLKFPTNQKWCQPLSVLRYYLMDFSFSVWLLGARFLLQLSNIHFKVTLWAISLLDEKDVHLMGHHFTIHPLKVNTVHAAEHLLHSESVLQEFNFSGYEVW